MKNIMKLAQARLCAPTLCQIGATALNNQLNSDYFNEMKKNIFFDNRLKWFQYQVTRGTLKTNRIISKFKNDASVNCTYVEQMLKIFLSSCMTALYAHSSRRSL